MKKVILKDRYEILSEIGIGGMGTVYKAVDLKLDRIVAIKILKEELTDDETFVRRFENEAKAIARLKHNNIVMIYDINNVGKKYFIVMEYIVGKSLRDILRKSKVINYKEGTFLFLGILRAISHAHDKNIIHRDIKPHNIMISEEEVPKVLDFGIAKLANEANLTKTGSIIGSITYISPEQANGLEIDKRSDIYSLGITYYEMLTGKPPFLGDVSSVIMKHIREVPIAASKKNPLIPQKLSDLILKMLKKDPNDRFQSLDEIIESIEEFIKYDSGKDNIDYKNEMSIRETRTVEAILKNEYEDNDLINSDNNYRNRSTKVNKKYNNYKKLLMSLLILVSFSALTVVVGSRILKNYENTTSNIYVNNMDNNTASPLKSDIDTFNKNQSNVLDYEGEYIFPDSSNKLLTDDDLSGLRTELLRYGRNEIFAKHGYIFNSDDLNEYFNSKKWYNPKYDSKQFGYGNLSAVEKKNVKFLESRELVENNNSEYIFPESNIRYLCDEDLIGKSKNSLEYGRNEIFARHGYIFETSNLISYFNSKTWYEEKYEADNFDYDLLSEVEKYNVDYLEKKEDS